MKSTSVKGTESVKKQVGGFNNFNAPDRNIYRSLFKVGKVFPPKVEAFYWSLVLYFPWLVWICYLVILSFWVILPCLIVHCAQFVVHKICFFALDGHSRKKQVPDPFTEYFLDLIVNDLDDPPSGVPQEQNSRETLNAFDTESSENLVRSSSQAKKKYRKKKALPKLVHDVCISVVGHNEQRMPVVKRARDRLATASSSNSSSTSLVHYSQRTNIRSCHVHSTPWIPPSDFSPKYSWHREDKTPYFYLRHEKHWDDLWLLEIKYIHFENGVCVNGEVFDEFRDISWYPLAAHQEMARAPYRTRPRLCLDYNCNGPPVLVKQNALCLPPVNTTPTACPPKFSSNSAGKELSCCLEASVKCEAPLPSLDSDRSEEQSIQDPDSLADEMLALKLAALASDAGSPDDLVTPSGPGPPNIPGSKMVSTLSRVPQIENIQETNLDGFFALSVEETNMHQSKKLLTYNELVFSSSYTWELIVISKQRYTTVPSVHSDFYHQNSNYRAFLELKEPKPLDVIQLEP